MWALWGVSGPGVYEVALSVEFPDWDTALRVLRACEADQRATARLLDLLDETYNAKLRRATERAVDEV